MSATESHMVTVVRSDEMYESRQGLLNIRGVSAGTCGASGLWMGTITIPPGGRASAHLHADHETALYILEGEAEMWWGEELEHHIICRAGDFIYIPAGVPHIAANASQTERAVAIGARTDANEQESVVLLPELEQQWLDR